MTNDTPPPEEPTGQSLILEGAVVGALLWGAVTLAAVLIIPVAFADDSWRTPAEYWMLMSDRGEAALKLIVGALLVGALLGGAVGWRWERARR